MTVEAVVFVNGNGAETGTLETDILLEALEELLTVVTVAIVEWTMTVVEVGGDVGMMGLWLQ